MLKVENDFVIKLCISFMECISSTHLCYSLFGSAMVPVKGGHPRMRAGLTIPAVHMIVPVQLINSSNPIFFY